MNTFGLSIKGRLRNYAGPSCWKELTDRQSVVVMRVRTQVAQDRSCLFPLLKILYGMPFGVQRWLFDDIYLRRKGLEWDEIDTTLRKGQLLLDSLNWIGQDDADAVFPVRFRRYSFQYGSPAVLLRQLINRRRYFGPGPGLENCTFEEFMFADLAFQKRDWAKLAAVLYRPAGSLPQDNREPFDRYQVEARSQQFAALDAALLERIAFGYACTLVRLKKFFPLIFQSPTDTQGESAGQKSTQKQNTWLDVAINMVKLDVTRVAEVEKQNLYLALKVLNEQIRQGEEMQEQIDKMNQK